jgi:hypothetical protein
MPDNKPLKVYAIEDNGPEKKYWREIGIAWRNRDDSLNVKLYMMPLLKINIREQGEEKEGPR